MAKTIATRNTLGARIASRLEREKADLSRQFRDSGRINSCSIDNLLGAELGRAIHDAFPPPEKMVLKRTPGQKKYVGVQMSEFDPLLEEVVYAFQDPGVLQLVSQITGIPRLLPDEKLYAGGVSLMRRGNFLNPHLDNSHDKDQNLYRALNLLYYVTPDWQEENGGNLELWDDGPRGRPRTIVSCFDRLVIMMTHESSWHSVSEVRHARSRCCVSNYYFSPDPVAADASYHVTTFRGRPGERLADAVMVVDNAVRSVVRKTFGERLFKNPHVYKK